jgi:PAS domain S-box-containing protein
MDNNPIRVLLVDDDEDDYLITLDLLSEIEGRRFNLEWVATYDAALKTIGQNDHDVYLLDYRLGERNGLELLREAVEKGCKAPMILLTGQGDHAIDIEAMKVGAADYLIKGQIEASILERSIRYAIERKRAEEALRESEARYRSLFETMGEGVVLIAPDGQIVQANPAAERLLGLERSEIKGRLYTLPEWEILRPDGTPMPPEEMVGPRAMKERRPVKNVAMSVRRPDGSISWLDASAAPLIDEGGGLGGVVGTFTDITERVRAEQALWELNATLEAKVAARTAEIVGEREKSETILRSVDDAIVMTDREMLIRYVNPAFTTLTGYTAEEVLGQHAGSVGTGVTSEQVGQSIQLALAKGHIWQGEALGLRKDGRTYDAALTITPMHDAEGQLTGYVSSHHDITRLKELDRARSRFIINVSHQLRTPVTNLKLYLQLLRGGRRPEKTESYLQVLEDQTNRLRDLIEDMLEMTALDSGDAVAAWEPVHLSAVIGAVITRHQSQAEASGLTLAAMPLPPDLPAVKGDPARLTQALGELVENAVVFTPAGGQVTVEARTAEEQGQRWVTVAVRDTGPGISVEERERLFDRFYRGGLAESGHVPGTGLGLSIAQEIAHAHGGRVTVESPSTPRPLGKLGTAQARDGASSGQASAGRGSTFTLWLRGDPDQAGGLTEVEGRARA